MDKLTLQGATDFALTTDALAFMQSAYEALEKLGALGGDNYIVSGCEVSGSSVTSGWIFLKGKLMPFTGGTIQTYVRIIKTISAVNVDIASREQTTYHAEFGTSANPDDNVAWADIKRPAKLVDVYSRPEVNALFNIMKVNVTDFSSNSDIDNNGSSEITFLKSGKTVIVTGALWFKSGAGGDIFTIPSEIGHPVSLVHFSIFDSDGNNTLAYCKTDGNISLATGITTYVTRHHFNFSYMTND